MNLFLKTLPRQSTVAASAALLLVLGGCASPANKAASSAPAASAPVVVAAYVEHMASAEQAQKQGQMAEALSQYEIAAKADPAKKQPWLKIAQAQFDARNYGHAINAAQEALQRDNTDVTAKSILAVSGLRVSASALEQLRQANALAGNTRGEAQSLAKTLREALGEPILPAAGGTAAAADTGKPATVRPVQPVRRTYTAPAPTARAAAPAVAKPAAPAAASAAAPAKRNPFDALK